MAFIKQLLVGGLAWLLVAPVSHALEVTRPIIVSYTNADQPPILFNNSSAGLCIDIIAALNELQNDYHFEFRSYPGNRLLRYLKQPEKFDMLMYYNPIWVGNAENLFDTSLPLTRSREVMIALKKPQRTQDFFDYVGKVPSVGVRGFHYAFTDFTTDPRVLEDKYQMTLATDELKVIDMIIHGRGLIGLVKDSSLAYYATQHPTNAEKLLVSLEPHTQFDTMFLVRKTAPINHQTLNNYLKTLSDQGVLTNIYTRYGMQAPKY